MKVEANAVAGVEVGNAWALKPKCESTNWVVGYGDTIPEQALRHAAEAASATAVGLKWFFHHPDDPPKWGKDKGASQGKTFSVLCNPGGVFLLKFWLEDVEPPQPYRVVLNEPGDFAIWGPGIHHSWEPLAPSVIVTMRWTPVP